MRGRLVEDRELERHSDWEEVLEQGVGDHHLGPVLSLHQAASGGLHFEGL